MTRKRIIDESKELDVLDLREIKPSELLEIKDIIEKDEAVNLIDETITAGYDEIEILGDE